MSDFPKAVARASEGHCPLCDGEMRRGDVLVVDVPSGEEHVEDPHGICLDCGIDWRVGVVDGRPMLTPSRDLTSDERRKLYDREGSDG